MSGAAPAPGNWVRIGQVCGWVATVPLLAWVLMALYFASPLLPLGMLALVVFTFWRLRRGALGAVLGLAFGVGLAWAGWPARNDRAWERDVAETASATVEGDVVTLRNVRNFSWRSLLDFTPRWETRTYRLSQLRHLDFLMTYWGSPNVCHTMLTFDFGEGGRLCVSIEARREVGEGYSALRGLFRQYELIYVFGDERDLVRLRTSIRPHNDVYLFRLNASPTVAQEIFRDYLRRTNELRTAPGWYNTLFTNCTTSIRTHVRHAGVIAPWDRRVLANGRVNELLRELGYIHRELPLPELMRASHIDAAAESAGDALDFSARIRAGRPGF